MKIVATLLLLATSVPQPDTGQVDGQAIVRAVLKREAYIHGSDQEPVCIRAAVDGIAIEGWRHISRTALSRYLGAAWTEPGRFDGKYFRSGNRLSQAKARPINEALREVLRGPTIPHFVPKLDPSWLPRSLSFCAKPDQWRRLEIASPAIAGDMAFVAADYFCPTCGEGVIFALRRSVSGWRIVAETSTWVS